MVWTPLPGPEEEDAGKEIPDVEAEEDLIGKPWTYRHGQSPLGFVYYPRGIIT